MTKNEILIYEFEKYLSKFDFQKEVVFSSIFNTKRKFRADYYIPGSSECRKTIIEINGGQFVCGRHNRGGKGYENDLTKSNIANQNGCRYLQFTYQMLSRLDYVKYL